jgi:hypothetical protein
MDWQPRWVKLNMNILKPLAVAAMSIAMIAPTSAAETMPEHLRGSWCLGGQVTTSYGKPAFAFSRGECKSKKSATLTYTAFGRFMGKGECRLEGLDDSPRTGVIAYFDCGDGLKFEELVELVSNNRITVLQTITGLPEKAH